MKKAERTRIYAMFDGRCAYCGEEISIKEMHVDHVIPRGSQAYCPVSQRINVEVPENLYPSCRVCNNWKRMWSVEDFRLEIAAQIGRLRKRSAPFRMAERYNLVKATEIEVVFYFET